MHGRLSEEVLFTGGKKYRLQFPVSTKNRKGWGTWAENHVSNIANLKLVAPSDYSSFLLLWVLPSYIKQTSIIPGYSY